MVATVPGGETQRREMHFFWLLDGSTSMTGAKIQSLNFAVGDAIPGMRKAAKTNPEVRLIVRTLRFASTAEWIGKPTRVEELEWRDIEADGDTAMGQALNKVADELDQLKNVAAAGRHFPSLIILVTDGRNTDGQLYDDALRRLNAHPLGQAAERFAIAIGSDADVESLNTFVGERTDRVLQAETANMLADQIKIVSQSAVKIASQTAEAAEKELELLAEKKRSDEATRSDRKQEW
jgi:uncharacterized protein YegL